MMTLSTRTFRRPAALAGLIVLAAVSLVARSAPGEPVHQATRQPARQALATTDGETPGLRLEISELRRTSGDTVTLRMTIVNGSGDGFLPQLFQLSLIDVTGKRKYFVARDGAGKCVCSDVSYVSAGKSINVWAKFSAPPGDVERVTVAAHGFMPAEDVPISR